MTMNTDHILKLAEIIREVDGGNRLGAAALAEAILREVDGGNRLGAAALAEATLSHPGSRWSSAIEPKEPTEKKVNDLSPAQKALAAFNRRYELCGWFEDDWAQQCLATALEAVADQVAPGPWRVNSCCDQREHSVRGGIFAIAAELRGNTTDQEG